MTDDDGSTPSGSIPEEMLKELKVMREALTKPTEMQEKNSALIFMFRQPDGNYEERMYRAMMISRVKGIGDNQVLLTVSPETSGVQGFQYTAPIKIRLYLSLRDYVAKTMTGSDIIDLTEYCLPPGQKLHPNLTNKEVGVKKIQEADGSTAILAGISPSTGKPFYAAPADEPFRVSFSRAKRRARKKSRATGAHYRVPTAEESRWLNMNRHKIGGFNTTSYYPDSYYWTSKKKGLFSGIMQRFNSSHGLMKGFRVRRLKVRLVRIA